MLPGWLDVDVYLSAALFLQLIAKLLLICQVTGVAGRLDEEPALDLRVTELK